MTAIPFIQMLDARAGSIGDHPAVRFKEGETFVEWTWSMFREQAARVATGLRQSGLGPGDHVMLLVAEPRAAVAAHFGAWMLGAVPMHVGLPYRLGNVEAFVEELRHTGRRLDARALVLSRALADFAHPGGGDVPLGVVDDWLDQAGDRDLPMPEANAPAMIQLTSGSTRQPRGVVVSHDRLLLHIESISAALPATPQSVGVTWLPLHHDMGLIGGLLYPFHNQFVVHVLSPLEFQGRPYSWLQTLSHVRATHTAAPPSAFAVCIALAPRAADAKLDLSALECAMTGAEPVSARILRRFSEAFAPTGFRSEAFFPVYGLAEATVAVTFPKPLHPTRIDKVERGLFEREGVAVPAAAELGAIEFVSTGAPIPHAEIRIVNQKGETVADRTVGEILVRSKTLMQGYYRDPDATGEAISQGWLRTGDLGYVADGELFVTGRLKEIIIKGGRNLTPSAIEEMASSVPGVRAGCVAAVGVRSIEHETEMVYVVAETKADAPQYQEISERVRATLKINGIAVDHIKLVPPGTLPKTTSGKIQRALLAESLIAEAPWTASSQKKSRD